MDAYSKKKRPESLFLKNDCLVKRFAAARNNKSSYSKTQERDGRRFRYRFTKLHVNVVECSRVVAMSCHIGSIASANAKCVE